MQIPLVVRESLDDAVRDSLISRIKNRLIELDAILVAHYYVDGALQDLAVETGGIVSDSLEMARFGSESNAKTLIVAGVRFMGETAKILNPEKRVLMPCLEAECSLDLGCPVDEFTAFCDRHPDRVVVVYANTSAAVKARSDWIVTSGSALAVVRHLTQQRHKIVWAPDKNLGAWIQSRVPEADMLLWDASCVVHDSFKAQSLRELRKIFPEAAVLVHPESPMSVIEQADVVGSTTAIVDAVRTRPESVFIVATDSGIFHRLRQVAPSKILIEAPSEGKSATCKACARCPWMSMNTIRSLTHALEYPVQHEIEIEETIRQRARVPIQRLLDFASSRKQTVLGNNDA